MFSKRLFDLLASSLGLIFLTPLLLVVALAVKFDSAGPVFFRQERVGRFGRIFRIHKFRTMVVQPAGYGLQITVGADVRITRVGKFLRHYKLDELPQLIDVVVGNMSLVGPRPEVPKYVAHYPGSIKQIVLSVRPGITDNASITYRSENEILGKSLDPERAYIEEILPEKLRLYVEYVQTRGFWGDLKIIFMTLWCLSSCKKSTC